MDASYFYRAFRIISDNLTLWKYMKRLLIAAFFMHAITPVFADAAAQEHQVTIITEQISPLDAMKIIEEETDYSFFYRNVDLESAPSVSVHVEDGSVEELLQQLFTDLDVSYAINGNMIVINGAANVAEAPAPNQESQNHRVTGQVTDAATGEPLVGATIAVRDETIGTVTNQQGEFSLTVPGADAVLEITYVGFVSMAVPVDGRSEITIELSEDVLWMDDVVVVGYGTERIRDLSTAVSVVRMDEVGRTPITDVSQAIQGRAAGVQVSQPSGKPGTGLTVRVRGSTSVQAGNEPLYVVDGVPTNNIQNLNPNDIASLQILKDASSAAIYGSRGANGVVLITTKRGREGVSTVNFQTNFGFSDLPIQMDALNTAQYRELMTEISGPGTVPESITTDTDWMDKTFGTGAYQDYQLSTSGGTDFMQYYLSLGYLSEEGIVSPASNERYNFRVNLDNQIRSWLKVSTNLSYSRRERRDTEDSQSVARGGTILSSINTPPFLEVWSTDPERSGQFMPNPYQPSWENPLAYMSRAGWDRSDRLSGNVIFNVNLHENVLWRTNFGVDHNRWNWYQFIDPIQTSFGRQENGQATDNENREYNWLLENTLAYDFELGNHSFGTLGGFTLQHNRWDQNYISVNDFPSNTSVQTLNVANQIINAGTVAADWALISFLGRVSYNYQSRYIISSTIRYDGSSKLAEGNRWGVFPSVSAAWRVTGESFMDGVDFLDDLKIRAGWGVTGNQEGIGNYASYGLFGTSRRPPTQPLSGPSMFRTSFENRDLKWETTTQTNVGMDIMAFDGRFTFSADAYLKKTDDLLLNVVVPRIGSADHITRNDGKMENRGLEFVVETRNITGNRFQWDTGFNISFNRNEVTELGLNQVYDYAQIYSNNENVIRMEPGMSLGTFYGYISDGVNPETGMIEYRDLTGTGTITAADRTVIGNAQPDFVYGMTNTFRYRGFELMVFLQGVQGNDIYNASRIDTEGMFDHRNQSTEVLDRWREPGDVTDIPRATSSMENVRNSTRFVEDGSYLRIKTLTLSYSLPYRWISPLRMSNLTVFGTGQNLYTFTGYSGFDPEVNAYGTSGVELGVDYGTYPQSRTIIFGFNIDL